MSQVLDVGCGEGILLQHLTHSPPWRAYSASTPAPPVAEKPDFIYVRQLHGLDIFHDDLLYAINVTAPPKHGYGWTRFESLDVSIWEGGLEAPNAAFENIECIVGTEV
jgi:small RNA 2'-O-methyltransferase